MDLSVAHWQNVTRSVPDKESKTVVKKTAPALVKVLAGRDLMLHVEVGRGVEYQLGEVRDPLLISTYLRRCALNVLKEASSNADCSCHCLLSFAPLVALT